MINSEWNSEFVLNSIYGGAARATPFLQSSCEEEFAEPRLTINGEINWQNHLLKGLDS